MLKSLAEFTHHTLTRIVFAITFFALIGASLVFLFEGSVNEQFKVMGDAVWWVLVTMTTVGYGDKVPMTTGGRVIGIIIMFFGLALLSSFTATISSFFITKKIKEGRGLEEIKLKNHLIIFSNILSDDYSYLDQFIRRKFEEAGRGLSEEKRINIRINPVSETIIDSKDFLILISKGDNL